MRSIKYYIACTADGFIAHEDGSVDGFNFEGEHVTDYIQSLDGFDTVLMGRKTYGFGLKLGVTNPYPTMKQYVFSGTMETSPDENVTLVSENIIEFITELKNEPGKDIYLCGGGEFATTLFTEHLIDEIILKLSPVLFGSGISLFSGIINQTSLELINSKTYSSGVVLLHYQVKN
jgi:dihydrofolate reductase